MSEGKVSEEDRKKISSLKEEIVSRISEVKKVMSTYVNMKESEEFSFRAKPKKGSVEEGVWWAVEVDGGCWDECLGMCYEGPCRS